MPGDERATPSRNAIASSPDAIPTRAIAKSADGSERNNTGAVDTPTATKRFQPRRYRPPRQVALLPGGVGPPNITTNGTLASGRQPSNLGKD